MNYTTDQIAKITGGTLYGDRKVVGNISTDSRSTLAADSLFVALVGAKRDGHDFVSDMIKRGCTLFLVENLRKEWATSTASFIVVKDTLQALQMLAADNRAKFKGEVVAITGSNGKTIVKEWMADLWDPANGSIIKSPRSYNSQLGVSLSLLMIKGEERVAIIEAGISELGEMSRLEAMIRPTIGVLTNIGDAHSENFTSRDEKLTEKLSLFENCRVVIRGDEHPYDTIQKHNLWLVDQIYAALGLSHLPIEKIEPVALRLEVEQGIAGSEIINDSYNSDLDSISTALDFQRRSTDKKKRVLILSDIEQSALSPSELYAKIATLAREYWLDKVVAIGSKIGQQKSLFNGIDMQFFGTTEQFLESINVMEFAESSVLLKGARSFRFEAISHAMALRTHTTTLEVNLSRIVDNLAHYRSFTSKKTKAMAMVKASAYGSGAVMVGRKLVEAGAAYLAVAFADEGVALRKGGITAPIVVLNSDPGSFAIMIEYGLEPEIYSMDSLSEYTRAVRREGSECATIHIKLDTGMHRLGFMPEELDELCQTLINNQTIVIGSIFSHLSSAEDPEQDDFTRSQISLFEKMSSSIIKRLNLQNCLRSLANTAGIVRFPEAHLDMVRVGIGLYNNVSTLRTRITQVKTVQKGESVGYNRASICTRETKLAIIPIGYADGMDRRLSSGVGRVSIGGVMCPTIGNICMDTTIVDVTDLGNVFSGDEVVIFGPQGPTVQELAETIGTISYEILTSISPRIKRLYVID